MDLAIASCELRFETKYPAAETNNNQTASSGNNTKIYAQSTTVPIEIPSILRNGFFLSYIHGYTKDKHFVRVAFYVNPNNENHFIAQYIERVPLEHFEYGCSYNFEGKCKNCGESRGHLMPADYFCEYPRPTCLLQLAGSGRPFKSNQARKRKQGNGNGYLVGVEKNPGPFIQLFSMTATVATTGTATFDFTMSSNRYNSNVGYAVVANFTSTTAFLAPSNITIIYRQNGATHTTLPVLVQPATTARLAWSHSYDTPFSFTSGHTQGMSITLTSGIVINGLLTLSVFALELNPTIDVNIVGISPLTSPVWTSEFNPILSPIPIVPTITTETVSHSGPAPHAVEATPYAIQRPKRHQLAEGYIYPEIVCLPTAAYFLPDLKRLAANRSVRIIENSLYNTGLKNTESAVSRGDEEALAAGWNQLMHALNGNSTSGVVFDDASITVLEKPKITKNWKIDPTRKVAKTPPVKSSARKNISVPKSIPETVSVPPSASELTISEPFEDDGLPPSTEQLEIAAANPGLEASTGRTYGHPPDVVTVPPTDKVNEITEKTSRTNAAQKTKLEPVLNPNSPAFMPSKPKHTLHRSKALKIEEQIQQDSRLEKDMAARDEETRQAYLRVCALKLSATTYQCVRIWLGEDDDWKLERRLPVLDTSEDKQKPPERSKPKGNKTAGQRISDAQDQEKQTQADHQQLVNVVFRLLNKIKTYSDAIEWIMTTKERPSDNLCLLLLSEINKRDTSINTSEKFVFTAICHRRPIYERLAGLSQFSTAVSRIVETSQFRDWMKVQFGIYWTEISDDTSWKAARQGAHNRVMHSTNGNIYRLIYTLAFIRFVILSWGGEGPSNREMHAQNGNTMRLDFPNTMADIKAHSETGSVVREKKSIAGCKLADPIMEVESQSGIKSIQGVNLSSVPYEMPIRGGIVSGANVFDEVNDLNHPEALLFPRNVRNGAGQTLIDSTNQLPLFGVGTLLRNAKNALVLSAHGTSLQEIITKNGNLRSNQITVFGFYTSEVAALVRVAGTDNGDSLVPLFLKLQLYNCILSWQFPENNQPLSCEVSKFDAFTQVDPNLNVAVQYNDGLDLFDEDCGGAANPVFPYTQAVPTIAFHACNQTVPRGRTPIYIRPSLLMQNDRGDNTINFALLAMALADFPCGLHSILIDTLDSTGGNAAIQYFTPLASCVHVTGSTALDFVIPVTNAFEPPRALAAANDNVVVRPSTGPTNWGALLANTDLNVNAIGVAYVSYDLAEFLGTWLAQPLSPIDTTTISRFCKQLGELTLRGQDLRFATEMAMTLAVRYPPMFENAVGVATIPAVNSEASVAMQNFFAQTPHVMTANVPQNQSLYDFYIPEMNVMWWNKIMTGAFENVADGAKYPLTNYAYDGSPRFLQYAIHITRDYAITAEYVFQYHRQSRLTWNNSFAQTPMVGVANSIRKYFVSAKNSSNKIILESVAGETVSSLHFKINGEAPASDMLGKTLWHYMNAPRVGFQGVYSVAGVVLNTPIPCIIPDIWSQLFSTKRTLAFAPFIPPLMKMVGLCRDNAQVTAFDAGGYMIPVSVKGQAREISINSSPTIDDYEVYNARLVYHSFVSDLYTLDGNVWAISTVTSPNLVSQKYVQPDYTVPQLVVASVPVSKTNWMPYNTSTGLRLLVGVTAANNANRMTQVMDGRSFASLSCWVFNNINVQPNAIVGGEVEDDGIWTTESEAKTPTTDSPQNLVVQGATG